MTRFLSGAAGALAVALTAGTAAAPASAETAGPEAFTTVVVATGASGQRQVGTSTVTAQGVFNGVGSVVEQPAPGDPGTASREDLVFPAGMLHLSAVTQRSSFSSDPLTCVFNAVVTRRGTFDGGTGQFAQASGTYTQTTRDWGSLSRTLDGSCSLDQPPLHDVATSRVTGSLSF
jgi:hypothetical protein